MIATRTAVSGAASSSPPTGTSRKALGACNRRSRNQRVAGRDVLRATFQAERFEGSPQVAGASRVEAEVDVRDRPLGGREACRNSLLNMIRRH